MSKVSEYFEQETESGTAEFRDLLKPVSFNRKERIEKAKEELISRIYRWNLAVNGYLDFFSTARNKTDLGSSSSTDPEGFYELRTKAWSALNFSEICIQNINQLISLLEKDWEAKKWCGDKNLWMDLSIEVGRPLNAKTVEELSTLDALELTEESEDEDRNALGRMIGTATTTFNQALVQAKEIVFWANTVLEMVGAANEFKKWRSESE